MNTQPNLRDSNNSDPKDDFYRTAFQNLKEGVIVINQDETVLYINTAAFKILKLKDFSNHNEKLKFFRFFDDKVNETNHENRPTTRLINKQIFGNEKYFVETNKNVAKICAVFSGLPQYDSNGKFIAGILFIHEAEEITHSVSHFNPKDEIRTGSYPRQLELFQKESVQDRELLRLIIDSIPVMITLYEKKADRIYLNDAFEKITGWTNEDARKRNIMELAYPEPEYRNEVMHFMESLHSGFKDIVMRTKWDRSIDTSWANVRLPDGRQVGVGIDISERKRLEKELTLAKEKAEKENQIQYAFIQNISHEVRTPMNSILGYTELLDKRISEKKSKEFLEAVSYNGKQLLRLIDDIIDVSRLDKNELSLSKENITIEWLMEQSQKQFSGLKKTFGKRNLKMELKLPEKYDSSILLYTDVYRLQQVLTNLISNAVKYTEKGKITLGFTIRRNKHDVLFFVKDTGIGIRKEDHKRVFTRFNRFHNTAESEYRGTGLGLSICKNIVALLGGKIWFESEPGIGSVFYFTHPFVESFIEKVKEEPEYESYNYTSPHLNNKTILIAEDDSFSFLMMEHMLEETNAHILHAENGAKALELLSQHNVDLLFLDIRLPEMDGYEVIKKIRQAGMNLPVIAQTASVLMEDRMRIRESGFNYHATKPLSQEELFSIINRFM